MKLIPGEPLWEPGLPLFVNRGGESFQLAVHIHDFIEIAYIAEGGGLHYIGSDQLHVGQGDLFVIPIGTSHVFRPYSIEQDNYPIVYNCVFERSYISRFLEALPQAAVLEQMFQIDQYEYRWYKNQHLELGPLIEKLYMEYTLRLPGYQLLVNSYMLHIISLIYRIETQEAAPSTMRNRLYPVIMYMDAHFAENLRMETLAAMVPMSVSHMQRLFKQLIGQSITGYLQSKRIGRSCELLRHTSESVREIAARVGYNDVAFFQALFKKKTGFSPYQYRKNH